MSAPRIIKSYSPTSMSTAHVVKVGHPQESEFVPDGQHAPQIECITEQGIIRRIEIRCTCGQLTTLICDYGESHRVK